MSQHDTPSTSIDRRSFLSQSTKMAVGAAMATTALSYSRILGANDRISLGHIGIGNRGRELDWIASQLKDKHNVEMTAVCPATAFAIAAAFVISPLTIRRLACASGSLAVSRTNAVTA